MAAAAGTPTEAAVGRIPDGARTAVVALTTGVGAPMPARAARIVAIGLAGMPMAAATVGGALREAIGIRMPAARLAGAMVMPAVGLVTRSPRLLPLQPMPRRQRPRRPGSATSARP